MSDAAGVCRYCGGPDEEDGVPTNSGTCGWCFYGMRLEPEEWRASMKAIGREVEYVGGCVPMIVPKLTDKNGVVRRNVAVLACRNPYEAK